MVHRFLNPSSELLARVGSVARGQRVILMQSDDVGLAEGLVRQIDGPLMALHSSYRALQLLARVEGVQTSDDVYPDPAKHGPADVILFEIPKGREHVRAALWWAAQTLRPGGYLYLAGANDAGAKTAIKDAGDLFGRAAPLGYRSGHRVAIAVRPDTLRLPDGWETPGVKQIRQFDRPEGPYVIYTMPGVFSWDHLDEGTAVLLDHLDVAAGEHVLDLGCGYGIIGLAAGRAGAQAVLVDDDLLAVRCAAANVTANGLEDRCRVVASDLIGEVAHLEFDVVLSNPPFHKGIDVTTGITRRLVRETYDVLRPGGRLRIVANRFLPYDVTLRGIFQNVRVVTENRQFYVLESVR